MRTTHFNENEPSRVRWADQTLLQKQAGEKPASASYRRDALGRTTEETITYGEGVEAIRRTLRHSFTPDGRRASLVYPDGAQIQYRFDQGRLQRADLPGDEAIRWTQYQWQQPSRIELPGAVRTLEYGPLQRPTHIQVQAIGPGTAETPTGPIHLDWRLAYDPAGNLIQRDTRDGPYSYAYDPLDRLIEVVPPASVPELPLEGYQYDEVGNRTQSAHQPGAWGYDQDNRLTQYGDGPTLTALTHSPNGQRAELITPTQPSRVRCADHTLLPNRAGEKPAKRTLPKGHHAA